MESDNNNNMISTEQIEQCSPFSWWWNSHNRPPHSHWLHSTLSELDNKIKMMLHLIEQDNGDTFAKRAEMYYEKRPQLIEMVQDLHRSYRALADKYDQLKSESSRKESNNGSLSNSFRKVRRDHHESLDQHCTNNPRTSIATTIEAPNFSSESSGSSMSLAKNSISSDHSSNELIINDADCNYAQKTNVVDEHEELVTNDDVWYEVQTNFSKLFEENSCKQAELIRRNDEKRKIISELRNENLILNQKLGNGSMRENKTPKRKFKSFFCLA